MTADTLACATCHEPLCVRCEQPTEEMLDRAIAVSRTGTRPTLEEIDE